MVVFDVVTMMVVVAVLLGVLLVITVSFSCVVSFAMVHMVYGRSK